MSGNVHEGELVRATPRADGVVEYILRPDEPLKFRPGQFVSVRVGVDSDDNPILRSYSIASPPGGPELALILKLIKGGPGSEFFERLKPGDRVRFTGPMGFFCLDLQHAGDIVFGVTGVGITPVLPMISELAARPERGRILLYWGNRHAEDLFWLDEFKALQEKCARLQIDSRVGDQSGIVGFYIAWELHFVAWPRHATIVASGRTPMGKVVAEEMSLSGARSRYRPNLLWP